MKKLLILLTALPLSASLLPAQVVLTFEGLDNLESVNDFYNGGTGGNGSSGTDYGISFNTDALALIDADAGGSGNTGLEPSPETVLFFLDNSAVMNVAAGFDTGFSFLYAAPQYTGSVTVYDGLDKTGNVLATINLSANGSGPGDPNGIYSNWSPIGVSFGGTAKSVDFNGTANYIVFDNITLGSETPITDVPEPSAIGMILAPFGIGLILFNRRRKMRQNKA